MRASPIRQAARRVGLRAAKIAIATALATLGLGFLTAALWQSIAEALSPIAASAILGAVFLSAATAITLWPRRQKRKPRAEVNANDLVQVFLSGLKTGRSIK